MITPAAAVNRDETDLTLLYIPFIILGGGGSVQLK
jgi:hypothetical protein